MATQTQPAVATPDLGPSMISRRWRGARHFVRRQPLGALGIFIIVVLVTLAVFAPLLTDVSPTDIGDDVLVEPSADHWFGTNRAAQDMWTRVIYGGRPSLTVGLAVVLIGVIGGTVMGLLAGYLGGWVDMVISRVFEVLNSVPSILFGLVIGASLGPKLDDTLGSDFIINPRLLAIVIAVSIAFLPAIGRILRGGVIAERNRQYVEAARVIGASETRVMFRHVLPNLLPLMIVLASTSLPAAILTEAALSYLGVGLPYGDASWGGDLGGSARQLFSLAPWLAIFPGVALGLTVLAFNLLGDSLRDELDPRLRGSGLRG